MTAQPTADERGRVHFGRLTVRPDPVSAALAALGEAVPTLEAALGFPLSVTAQPRKGGTIFAEVFMPDAHYNLENALKVCRALSDAARPYGVDVDTEVDSAI